MNWINKIDDKPNQDLILNLPTGDSVSLSLSYFESQRGWYYSLTYGTFQIFNRRIVTSVNMIRGFRNILPFGFACTTSDGHEPVFKDDFKNQRAKFFLLDSDDVQSVEDKIEREQISA